MAKKQTTKKKRNTIFVVGGVMSGVGKGVASSSIGTIMKARGLSVTALKIDPYINVDAGTMNPTEHGEVFVLEDGDETDQDMGNYERFLNTTLTSTNYMTTGRVYQTVIERERNLEYKGRNVEVIPDIPNEVISRIEHAADEADADITLVEIGGTLGEYQNLIFLEAARMMKNKNPDDVLMVMVSYLPTPGHLGEMKTKPTQYASITLNNAGLQAGIIIARGKVPLDAKRKEKIATFCNVEAGHVISAPDVDSIYDVPINFEKDKLGNIICEKLKLGAKCAPADLSQWKKFVRTSKSGKKEVTIAVVGKYFSSGDFVLSDVYISVLEALKFSSYKNNATLKIEYLSATEFEKNPKKLKTLDQYDGVLIPGGFGTRGIEGKLSVIKYVRQHKIPYFGICYGMQLMVVEYARNVLKWTDAHTHEINPTAKHLVIDVMEDQKDRIAKREYGGTMRLGSYPCVLKRGTIARRAYKTDEIIERHRHRYEVNPMYISDFIDAGLMFSGTSPDATLMEIAELPQDVHPFFLGAQFHPEFLARPLDPHPLFTAFIKAAVEKSGKK